MRKFKRLFANIFILLFTFFMSEAVFAQGDFSNQKNRDRDGGGKTDRNNVRVVTIPVTTILKKESRSTEELKPLMFNILEDGEPQQLLSVRGASGTGSSPLSLAILIQDDLVPSIGNEINALASFIRRLPRGSRVLVGYVRAGALQVKQKFTTDLERAAKSLRIPTGSSSLSPYNPYVEVVEALKRFESLPTGRRAVLLISDGLDISRGLDSSSPTQSIDLQRAINEAQRRSVAVYSIYAPSVGATSTYRNLINNAQGSLNRLSDETGGKAFFEGTGAPVSFDPFIRELDASLSRQIALTYLSTHTDKGYHRIEVKSEGHEIRYPKGYTR